MRNGATVGEPFYSIYGDSWAGARARVAALSSARLRREHGAILDYLEAGWELLRPLQIEAESLMAWRDLSREFDERVCVGDFVEVSVTDAFREVVLACEDCVGASPPERGGADLADEAEAVLRALLVLGMAASDPGFPPGLRGCVAGAVEGFGRWLPGLRPLLAPLERAGAPVAVAGLRVLD